MNDLHQGDAREVLKSIPSCSVDSCVTDPPAGIAFMGKDWDKDKGGRMNWTRWLTSVFEEVHRVLKPGGYCLVWALPRTSHWTAWAVEDAGFEIRDVVTHHFGTGFPKSLNVGKAIDKIGGTHVREQALLLKAKREQVGMSREDVAASVGCTPSSVRDWEEGRARAKGKPVEWLIPSPAYRVKLADLLGYSADDRRLVGVATDRREDGSVIGLGHSGELREGGNTDAAKQWEGFGTALKPASEHWILARKPLVGTVAANVLEHGTGALNIDGCRTRLNGDYKSKPNGRPSQTGLGDNYDPAKANQPNTVGRWPANLVLSHSPDCVQTGTREVKTGVAVQRHGGGQAIFGGIAGNEGRLTRDDATYGEGGREEVPAWECAPGCPVAELDKQSGSSQSRVGSPRASAQPGAGYGMTHTGAEYADKGGASRFFYTAKASKKERGEGNDHPTVKPLALTRWLARLVTPPGGVVLDPFMGSGTTGVAAREEGFGFIGVELDEHYYDIAQRRVGEGEMNDG